MLKHANVFAGWENVRKNLGMILGIFLRFLEEAFSRKSLNEVADFSQVNFKVNLNMSTSELYLC